MKPWESLDMAVYIDDMKKQIARLTSERDELLKAAEDVLILYMPPGHPETAALREAIAKARGEA